MTGQSEGVGRTGGAGVERRTDPGVGGAGGGALHQHAGDDRRRQAAARMDGAYDVPDRDDRPPARDRLSGTPQDDVQEEG